MANKASMCIAITSNYIMPSINSNDFIFYVGQSNQNIAFGVSNQVPTMTIHGNNVVGIANSNPLYTLDIGGDLNFSGRLMQKGAPYVGSQFSNMAACNVVLMNSNLGIGTSNPKFTLDVGGSINLSGTLNQNGTPYIGSQFSNYSNSVFLPQQLNLTIYGSTILGSNLTFSNATGNATFYSSSSNVGIGTSTPQAALHVNNNLRVDGSLLLANPLNVTGFQFLPGNIQNNNTQVTLLASGVPGYSNKYYGSSNWTTLSLPTSTSNDGFGFVTGSSSNTQMVLTGNGTLQASNVIVSGNATFCNTLQASNVIVSGNASFCNNVIAVSGLITCGSNMSLTNSACTFSNAGNMQVLGNTYLTNLSNANNANIGGNLQVVGNMTVSNINFVGSLTSNGVPFVGGSGGSSSVATNASFIPASNALYDLGSTTNRWNNLWLAGNAISFGNGTVISASNWTTVLNYITPTSTPSPAIATVSKSNFSSSCSSFHSAFISGGNMYTFGYNAYGQLGQGDTVNRTQGPVLVSTVSIPNPVQVAMGQFFTLALTSTGVVYGFGRNDYGQLGQVNTVTSSQIPVIVPLTGITGQVTQIACGLDFALFIVGATGAVWGIGNNGSGQLGNGTTAPGFNSTPVQMSTSVVLTGGYKAISVACGYAHSVVVGNNGNAYVCGNNQYGQLGANPTVTASASTLSAIISGMPTSGTNTAVCKAGCGTHHTILVLQNSAVYTFGRNDKGQLGNGSVTSASPYYVYTPAQVIASLTPASLTLGGVVSVDAGMYHTIVCMNTVSTYTTYGFGDNTYGQLGLGSSTTSYPTPTHVAVVEGSTSGGIQVGCGLNHTMWLLANNTFASCGNNSIGQIGSTLIWMIPTSTQTANALLTTPVYAPNQTIPNLIWESTSTYKKKLAVGGGSGNAFSGYIDTDGVLYTCGNNTYGQLGDETLIAQQNVYKAVSYFSQRIIASSGGYSHMCVIDMNGSVYAFGYNGYGQLGNNTYTSSSLPILIGSTALGNSSYGSLGLNVYNAGYVIVAVACGYYHTIALDSNGNVHAWGYNTQGQLGNNQSTGSSPNYISLVPINVSSPGFGTLVGKSIVSIACGYHHTIALDSNGNVHAWGYNPYGQLGNNTSGNQSNIPINISSPGFGTLVGKSIVAIACGQHHTVALDSNGNVHAWGNNGEGELGNLGTISIVPVNISSPGFGSIVGKTIVAIACGQSHTIALDSNGNVHAWGYNPYGQLGNNTSGNQSNIPINISSSPGYGSIVGKSIVAIACGAYHTYALDSNRNMHAWGYNGSGQLGNNSITISYIPIQISQTSIFNSSLLPTFTSTIALPTFTNRSTSITPYILSNGGCGTHKILTPANTPAAMQVLGNNTNHQIGDNSSTYRYTNSPIFLDMTTTASGNVFTSNIVCSASSAYHSAIVLANGSLIVWGRNTYGECGQNTSGVDVAKTSLALVVGITTAAWVACGNGFTIVVMSGGTVKSFGANFNGALGLGTSPSVTSSTTLASAGTSSSSLLIPALTGIQWVVAGDSHCLALDSNQCLWVWGNNANGQLGQGNTTSPLLTPTQVSTHANNVIDISAGVSHSMIISTISGNPIVYTCGDNTYGQCGVATNFGTATAIMTYTAVTLPNSMWPVAVRCGSYHSVVQRANNTINTFGNNTTYQLGVPAPYNTTTSSYPTCTYVPQSPQNLAWRHVVHISASAGTTYVECLVPRENNNLIKVRSFGRFDFASGDGCLGQGGGAQSTMCMYNTKVGTLYAWGTNTSGQLGTNTQTSSSTPALISQGAVVGSPFTLGTVNIVAVACGNTHTIALDSTGNVYAWGNNDYGEVGNNNMGNNSKIPINISSPGFGSIVGKNIVAIACGTMHTIALDSNGNVHAWGWNANGDLGNNKSTGSTPGYQSSIPINISSPGFGTLVGKTIVAIACGNEHTIALDSNGNVHSWGWNNSGQLGNNIYGTNSLIPINISTFGSIVGKSIVAIACGQSHTIALDSNGNVHAWGYNAQGQLGNNTQTDSHIPINISSFGAIAGKFIAYIACADYNTYCIDIYGTGYGCGQNGNYQVGDATNVLKTTMVGFTQGQLGIPYSLTQIAGSTILAYMINNAGMLYVGTTFVSNSTQPYSGGYSGGPIGYTLTTNPAGSGTPVVSEFFNITGQHRCFIKGYNYQTIPSIKGLLVSTNQNAYMTETTRGKKAITMNDSLPLVSLTTTARDKSVFGVVSLEVSMNPPDQSTMDKIREQGDVRAQINALGEGSLWVSDFNGSLEAGDYITSSTIPGYSMRQDDDFTHSYTVGKMTCSCDFTNPLVPTMKLRVDAWGNTVLDPESGWPIWDPIMVPAPIVINADGTSDPVSTFVPQLEESYDMRYLLGNGNIITLAQYNEHKTSGDVPVYRAAMVGVVYLTG